MIGGDGRLQRANRFCSRSGVCSRARVNGTHTYRRDCGRKRGPAPQHLISTAAVRDEVTSIVLSVIAAAFAVASLLLLLLLIDVLVRRADVTAALLIGSALTDAFFANAVPSLTLPGDITVGIHRYHRNTCCLCCVRQTSSDGASSYLSTMAGAILNPSNSVVSERSSRFRNPNQHQ